MTRHNAEKALSSHLSVLDLTDDKAGLCAKLLADMGARVIKIQEPDRRPDRDPGAHLPPGARTESRFSSGYNHSGKLGVTLNLEHPAGREVFGRMVARSDVVVESYPPEASRRLGLGFDELNRLNPRLIVASITGFGQSGPKKDYKTCDLVAAAAGGQMAVTGSPEAYPLKLYGLQSYATASLFAATAILIALRQRRKTGRGEHIDISMQEAVLSSVEHILLQYFYNGVVATRQGSQHWNNLFRLLPCRDGFIQITLFEQWETLVGWMESDGMAEDLADEKWRDPEYRLAHSDHVVGVLARWTRTHSRAELFELGQLMRFAWAPVQSPTEILGCPQLTARGFFEKAGTRDSSGTPFPAPVAGKDNIAFYRNELNFSLEQIEALASQGII
jgi:crotonobetainyl-CoA:carnitine CoA-transferase CaiB-like acyl-CoA transferase